ATAPIFRSDLAASTIAATQQRERTIGVFGNEINHMNPDYSWASNLARELNRVIPPAQKKNNPRGR
ncbi:MAG: hypothetical protein O7G84_08330, partial [Gammaproteobacteria bacterium]|nr:hypothetical protein [Gammaproteobacteria bacterium]